MKLEASAETIRASEARRAGRPQCDLPPEGWVCYLEKGHSGPCPAYTEPIRHDMATRTITMVTAPCGHEFPLVELAYHEPVHIGACQADKGGIPCGRSFLVYVVAWKGHEIPMWREVRHARLTDEEIIADIIQGVLARES